MSEETREGGEVAESAVPAISLPEEVGITPQVVTETPEPQKTGWRGILTYVRTHARTCAGIGSVLAIVAVATYLYCMRTESVPPKQFTNVYSFVPEKISMDAMIPISLPEGVSEEVAVPSITFSPSLKGTWVDDTIPGRVTFDPDGELKLGTYYAVSMDTGAVRMSGDFLVDNNPRVEAVFPRKGSEANEDSKITILFNRPMVPLTTLALQESKDIPITITPATPGHFKWVSTRNLQFIPDTTLRPSSRYTVSIGRGLTSIDGLTVDSATYEFQTRPLRYVSLSEDGVGYRSPIAIVFNQPVNLDETRDHIHVSNGRGDTVKVNIEYGETTTYDWSTGESITKEDQSKLFVYQKEDSFGREKVWDFETSYTLTITGAVPKEGDITLDEARAAAITIPHIVGDITAISEKSSLAAVDLFDPEGTLVVHFHDEIDKDRSNIEVRGLRNMVYGERCKRDAQGEEIPFGDDCEKEEDRTTLILSFNKDEFHAGDVFTLQFKKLYTRDGFLVNKTPLTRDITVYPNLTILRTVPADGVRDASLQNLYVCTNAPLREPGEEGMKSHVKTDTYIVFGRWSDSYRVEQDTDDDYYHREYKCNHGEYETEIQYGLLPSTPYTLTLAFSSAFGSQSSQQLSFTTVAPGEQYTRFHNMQKQYNVTRPDHTRLTYAVENLEYVDLHICKLGAESFLKRLGDGDELQRAPSADGCLEVKTDRIELPARYWVNNYFQVDLHTYFTDTRGQYVLTFGNPLYRDEYTKEAQYDVTYVSVTGLAVGKKEVHYEEDEYYWGSSNPLADGVLKKKLGISQNLYWVTDSTTLSPVVGATIAQYHKGVIRGATGVTDGEGIAKVQTERDVDAAIISYGGDVAVVSDWADTFGWTQNAENSSRTYLYTDRPIYRPGHTVYIRGIDRIGFDGAYEVWQQNNVPLIVYDTMGEKVYDTMLAVSPYGTFSAEFTLPLDAPLGSYRIEVFNQSAWFDVEEYVPAPFKLELGGEEEYESGETVTLDVQADYYFGVPVSGGEVSYSVTAQDYYFDRYTDEYFNFGSGWYYCYSCGYGDQYLFRGEAMLDDQGHARISRAINLNDFFKDEESAGSKLVTFTVSTKDTTGRSVSAQRTFIVHKGQFYIGAVTSEYFTGVNTPVTLKVKTVDTTGKPISLRDIERTVYKIDWDIFKRQEVDGGFYYRSERKQTEMGKEMITTDNDGNWSGTLTFPKEGEYEVHISKIDEKGNRIDTTTEVYIYGESAVVPPNNNYDLDMEVVRTDMKVGEEGSLLIKSPYPHAKVLITAERGTVFDYWVKDVNGGLLLHTFPVKNEYIPNVYLSAILLSNTPEVKYGTVEFNINRDEHLLDIEVTANKETYLPGEEVTLRVVTKDMKGNAVPAEVSVAVADLSVLALKGNPKKDPLSYFYSGFPLSVVSGSNIKNILYEMDIPLGTKGGGGDPNDLATKKRGIFKDTAYWNAALTTNADGYGEVTFTLPDNLTTWQIESIGITKDTKVGADYKEFTTKKDLMAVPLTPRFIVPGDTFMLGAKVFNETEKSAKVQVELVSDTLAFAGSQTDTVTIGEGETKTVYFEVTAPHDKRAGEHLFTFKASYGGYVDEVERDIPITQNLTHETVATAGMTTDTTTTEYLYVPDEVAGGDGGLTIHANATLATFMTDALTYMATYPHGCSEQLASTLSTIAILKSAFSTPHVSGGLETIEYEGVTYSIADVVKNGLTKIYETQNTEGGFSYYKGTSADVWLSVHVLTALTELTRAGFTVREDVLMSATKYIEGEVDEFYRQYPEDDRELVILAEYALKNANGNKATKLTPLITQFIQNKAFLNEEISSMTLAYLAILTANGWNEQEKKLVYETLLNRIRIDGRGAYLTSGGYREWRYYETPIKDTALLLQAFVAHGDRNTHVGNVLRWLFASRDANGVWGSTQNTFVVIDAMTRYLAFTHESEAVFTLRGMLGKDALFEHAWNSSNVFEMFTHTVPIDTLARHTLLPLSLTREDSAGQKNTLYYDMSLKYFLPVEALSPRDEGITITRDLFALMDTDEKTPLTSAKVGDIVKGKLTVTIPGEYTHVAIEDFIPAGFEIVNQNLDTERGAVDAESQGLGLTPIAPKENSGLFARALTRFGSYFGQSQTAQTYEWDSYMDEGDSSETNALYPTHSEAHDDRVFLYVDSLEPGVYEYEYYLRALVPGTFSHLPARAEELYSPDIFGRTSGDRITVTE